MGQIEASESVSYSTQGNRLLIHFKAGRTMDLWKNISFSFLGYKKGVPFSFMPKIKVTIRMNRLSIKNKRESLSKKELQLTSQGKDRILSVPLSLLGSPNFILIRVKTKQKNFLENDKAWRALTFD